MSGKAKVAGLAAAAAAFGALAAHGYYIERLYPLRDVIRESTIIAEGVIERVDARRRTCVARITGSLKGSCEFEEIRMNIGVGQMWHPETIVRHLVPQAKFVIFYNKERKAIAYVNHFFFQLYGDPAGDPARAWWNFTHIEIYMNRTFDGPTPELIRVVKETIEGKAAPAADPKKRPLTKALIDALEAPRADGSLGEGFAAVPPPPKPKAKSYAPDEEGFLRNWLLLEPAPVSSPSGIENPENQKRWLEREWFPGQHKSAPRPEDMVRVRGVEVMWSAAPSDKFFADLTRFATEIGKPGQSAWFLGQTFIFCDEEIADVRLSIGSDDSSLWRLNGQEAIRVYASRALAKDQDRSEPLTLKKGMNVLMFAVINVGGEAGACARFLDKEGRPVRGFTHHFDPKGPPDEY
jgi:hypothetical protein